MIQFSPVDKANEEGLLCIGGTLNNEVLESAYRQGIFPWPVSKIDPILWFAPPKRAILDFKNLKVSSRLQRYFQKSSFTFKVNKNFEAVIKACSVVPRKRQSGTWITSQILGAYINLHKAGLAHSFEAYQKEKLVGGMYGIWIDNMFAGESMFHHEDHASKFVLIETVNYLKQKGLTWMDVQVMTPLLKSFGAKEISRKVFMARLKKSLS